MNNPVYMSHDLMHKNTGIEILPAAFTDHNAVVLRLALGESVARRGRARWKFDPNLIQDAGRKTQIRQQWDMWKLRKPHYPNVNHITHVNLWWYCYVK